MALVCQPDRLNDILETMGTEEVAALRSTPSCESEWQTVGLRLFSLLNEI